MAHRGGAVSQSMACQQVAIWDHERSEEQMQAHRNFELTGNESGPIGFWPLDEGSGTTAHDRSPAGNHFHLHGGDWVGK